MREEYIRVIREYINAKPDYREAINELRANVLSIGATEEELDEALREMAVPDDLAAELRKHILEQRSLRNRWTNRITVLVERAKILPPSIKKRYAFVGAISFALIIGVISLGIAMGSNTAKRQAQIAQTAPVEAEPVNNPANLIARPVYASTETVDSNRVFSFPASKVTLAISGTPKKKVYGFFPYWMLDNQDKISLAELTNIGLFGLEVDGKGNIVTGGNGETVDGGWAMWNSSKLPSLIARAKRERVDIEVVIKCFNNANIESLVQSDSAQKTFISNALFLVKSKGLKGINLDFEYVGTPSTKVSEGFTRLVTNLNSELKRQIAGATLTVDTYLIAAAYPSFFDVELLAQQTDALIIMGYDVHTPQGEPGPLAPMEGSMYGLIGMVQSYLEKVPAEKLILAVPYYAYDWTVVNPRRESSHMYPYAEVAEASKNNKIQWDAVSQTPWYRYNDPDTKEVREVHFEDTRSLGVKYDFVNKKNLAGIGIWALGYDGLNNDLRSLIIEKFAN